MDVTSFPEDVKRVMGFCLNKLQEGAFDDRIEPMTGHASLKATPQRDIDTIVARLSDVRTLRKVKGYAS